MAHRKISRAELKKRLRIVVEAWPIELTQCILGDHPGTRCVMQIALNTDAWDVHELSNMVSGDPIGEIEHILYTNDHGDWNQLMEAIEAL